MGANPSRIPKEITKRALTALLMNIIKSNRGDRSPADANGPSTAPNSLRSPSTVFWPISVPTARLAKNMPVANTKLRINAFCLTISVTRMIHSKAERSLYRTLLISPRSHDKDCHLEALNDLEVDIVSNKDVVKVFVEQ
jgi:hypothetical protein